MSEHPMIVAMKTAGFDPLDPSPECLEATARPWMHPGLSDLDKRGIHAELLAIDALVRFKDHLKPRGSAVTLAIGAYATLHALRAEGYIVQSVANYERVTDELAKWKGGPLRESIDRARSEPQGLDEHNPSRYEPGLTFYLLREARGWADRSGDLGAIRKAMLMQEYRGIRKGDRARRDDVRDHLHNLQLTDEEIGDFVLGLMDDERNKGKKVSYITNEGRIRIGAEEIRGLLEASLSPVRHVQTREWLGEAPPQSLDPATDVEDADSLESVQRHLAVLRLRSDPGSVRALVLEHFVELVTETLSLRDLADRSSKDRATISKHLVAVRKELKVSPD